MSTPISILICGRDAALLKTRGLVLESAGYDVTVTLRSLEFEPDLSAIKLMIVCHTLSENERRQAISILASRSPQAKIVCLAPTKGAIDASVTTVDSFRGPRMLLDTVKSLVAQ